MTQPLPAKNKHRTGTHKAAVSPQAHEPLGIVTGFLALLLAVIASAASGQAPSILNYFQQRPAIATPPLQTHAPSGRRFHLSLYAAQWAEINLPSLPKRIVTADIPLRDTFFVSLGAAWVIVPNFEVPLGLFDATGLDFELEGQLVQHFGFQNHMEGTFAFVLRTGELNLFNFFEINFAVGEGLSLAFANPRYEKGPDGHRNLGTRRFQNHLLFEFELTLRHLRFVHAVIRLHHRSGVYGLISPQKTGSNYVGLGIRFDHL